MGLRDQAAQLYHPQKDIPFTPEEYRDRLQKVKRIMAREGIELLYCSAPESLFYLTGYESSWLKAECPEDHPPLSGIAIRQEAEDFIFFDREREEILVRTHTISTDIRIHRADFKISEMDFIIKNLKEKGWLKGTVGLEKGSYRPSPAASRVFEGALKKEGCDVVDAFDVVREVRAIKSPQEMFYTKVAARIADLMMKAAIETIRPGMTELDVRAEVDYACGKAGGEVAGIPTKVLAGQRTGCAHGFSSRSLVMPGDIVNIDLCGVFHRYHANLQRTFSMGEPHPKVSKQAERAAGVWPVLLEHAKANSSVRDLNRAVEKYYRDVGIWEDQWYVGGYELGIAFPPDWVGVFFYGPAEPGDRILPPGTVINHESVFCLPELVGRVPVINTLAIYEDTTELLSRIPPDLIVIER